MRLLELRPANFRAFGDADPINLDSPLVIVVGDNGAGKTSLAEAVEWLFYGETSRRRRGESYSKLEYRNSLANVHSADPTEVSARVRLPDGTTRALARRLVLGPRDSETSQTSVDGRRETFRSLGLVLEEAHCPVIAQHGLQDFIHSAPGERRSAVSAMLGLDALTSFKASLDKARGSFLRSPPPEVQGAQTVLRELRGKLAWNGDTAPMAERWREDLSGVDAGADWLLLLAAARKALGASPPEEGPGAQASCLRAASPRRHPACAPGPMGPLDHEGVAHPAEEGLLAAGLQARREEVVARLFDPAGLRPPPDLAERLAAIRLHGERAAVALADLKAAARRLGEAEGTAGTDPGSDGDPTAELLAFWEAGLRLLETQPARGHLTCAAETRDLASLRPSPPVCECPMCGEPTLAPALREELARRVRAGERRIAARGTLEVAARQSREALAALGRQVEGLLPRPLDEPERERLEALLFGAEGEVAGLLDAGDRARATGTALKARLAGLEEALRPLPGGPGDPELAERVLVALEAASPETLLPGAVDSLVQEVTHTAALFSALEREMADRVTSAAAVRAVDALQAGLAARQALETVVAYHGLREDLAAVSRDLERFIQEKQRELLAAKQQEVAYYYDLMNPGAPVRFLEMEPAANSTRLNAESFGVKLSAPACLSEGQLNGLALGVGLMRVSAAGSPFGFVVLDDPFQGMDFQRCESFITRVIPELTAGLGKQVILLTLNPDLADRAAYICADSRPLQYRLEYRDRGGPRVLPAG